MHHAPLRKRWRTAQCQLIFCVSVETLTNGHSYPLVRRRVRVRVRHRVRVDVSASVRVGHRVGVRQGQGVVFLLLPAILHPAMVGLVVTVSSLGFALVSRWVRAKVRLKLELRLRLRAP